MKYKRSGQGISHGYMELAQNIRNRNKLNNLRWALRIWRVVAHSMSSLLAVL